ncbi:MAG: ABC-F family ATP-binding cassette domain-containing protein [Paludibacteraceae bacterium]|nr:ABC-F family ATP-binding cassette domain-containing protein [Paludibacteraceae bacterium]
MGCYLQVSNLTKSFGDKILFENISFGLHEGQRMALLARNGKGKTSLLNILSGKDTADSGNVIFKNDIQIAFLEQVPKLDGNTVLDACFNSDSRVVKAISRYEYLVQLQKNKHDRFLQCAAEFEQILGEMDALNAWNYESRIKQILGKLGILDLDKPLSQLSGGQQKRLALAKALIMEPDLLILDEPTNHLDLVMVEWLEDFLKKSKMTLLLVTHDRYFLDRVCSDIIEIDNKTLYSYHGNYTYYLDKKEAQNANFNAEQKRIKSLYKKELEWMRRQPQARATKSQSRIDAFNRIEQNVKIHRENKNLKLDAQSVYIGSKIFEVQYVSKSFGDLKILDNFYYNFSRYEKMGIIGNNGTGKSTFLRMLLGEIPVDSGRFDIGESVRFGYYSQNGLNFDEGKKVIDIARDVAEIVEIGNGKKVTASQFLTYFLFAPEQQQSYVYKLSGGELRRLYLCTILMQKPNFLVLDEPTNDLDISTLNILEEYLRQFNGCLIVVSHDRFFMNKIVDHLLVFEGNGRIKDFPGNYSDYCLWKEAQNVEVSETPVKKERIVSSLPNAKKKLSFKEKQEFEALEKEIENLEQEKSLIEKELASGALSNDDLTIKSIRFGEITQLIDEKTTRWLELSELA